MSSKHHPAHILITGGAGFIGTNLAAHLLAAILGMVAALIFMLYLGERRRSYVMQILVYSTIGALVILFAFYGLHLAAFRSVFTGGADQNRTASRVRSSWLTGFSACRSIAFCLAFLPEGRWSIAAARPAKTASR